MFDPRTKLISSLVMIFVERDFIPMIPLLVAFVSHDFVFMIEFFSYNDVSYIFHTLMFLIQYINLFLFTSSLIIITSINDYQSNPSNPTTSSPSCSHVPADIDSLSYSSPSSSLALMAIESIAQRPTNVSTSTLFPLANHFYLTIFSPSRHYIISVVIDHIEPLTYSREVMSSHIFIFMASKIHALETNRIWSICALSPNKISAEYTQYTKLSIILLALSRVMYRCKIVQPN